MLWVAHEPSLCEVPFDDEQSHQVHYRGGSGQQVCVPYMMDSGTLQGMGGDTLGSCRDNGGRVGETESEVNEVNACPTVYKEEKMQSGNYDIISASHKQIKKN